MSETETDAYATAKANLRDTVKWLAASLAAPAALVLAGSPFTGFGSLPIGPRFFVACAALAGATLLMLWIWQALIFLLRSDVVFPSQLRGSWVPGAEPAVEVQEIQALRTHIAAHAADLLPVNIANFDCLEDHVATLWHAAEPSPAMPGGNPAMLAQWEKYNGTIKMVLNYATFERLHRRVQRTVPLLLTSGVVVAALLVTFVWVANPPKTEAASGSNVTVLTPFALPEKSALPALTPVLFALGKSDLDATAIQAINAARDFVRAHPDTGLLLLAHTDTLGSEPFNRDLAARRGARVQRTLTETGGLPPSRVFAAALPKTDLPRITPAQTAETVNRSVELLVVSLPAR